MRVIGRHCAAQIPTVKVQAAVEWQSKTGDLGCGGCQEGLAIFFEKPKARCLFRLLPQQRFESEAVHGAKRAMAGDGKLQGVEFITPLARIFHLIGQRQNV